MFNVFCKLKVSFHFLALEFDMLPLVLIIALTSCVAGQLHGVCHSNHLGMTENAVIGLVSMVCDRNKDGVYTEAEIFLCTSEIVNQPLPADEATILGLDYQGLLDLPGMSAYTVHRHDFVHGWHLHFRDSPEFAGATFDAFDSNRDGVWSAQEIDGILGHMKTYDTGDNLLQHAEFEAFLKHMYAC